MGPIEQRARAMKWLAGVVLALALAVYGLSVVSSGHARIRTGRGLMRSKIELEGFDARLYGMGMIVAALALHCGLFWRIDDHYWWYGEISLAITGIACAALGFWLLARLFIGIV